MTRWSVSDLKEGEWSAYDLETDELVFQTCSAMDKSVSIRTTQSRFRDTMLSVDELLPFGQRYGIGQGNETEPLELTVLGEQLRISFERFSEEKAQRKKLSCAFLNMNETKSVYLSRNMTTHCP